MTLLLLEGGFPRSVGFDGASVAAGNVSGLTFIPAVDLCDLLSSSCPARSVGGSDFRGGFEWSGFGATAAGEVSVRVRR